MANNSGKHVIGTYNLSFMSDLSIPIGPGMAFASEGAFLARLHGKPAERRKYWTNAVKLLKEFLEEKQPSVVGLQEVNETAAKNDPAQETGSAAINRMLAGMPYKQEVCTVTSPDGKVKAGASIIYNTTKVGEKIHSKCLDNLNPFGRPILLLVTEKDGKNYLSVSMHGAQNPGLRLDKAGFNSYMLDKNKKVLETEANQFLTDNGITSLAGIFITGDFNDRYDAIKDIKILGMTADYKGAAPKSCCYNWDSSCPDEDVQVDFGDGYKTCKEPSPAEIKNSIMINNNANPGKQKNVGRGKLPLPGERGAVKNYKYAGDKVFGLNPVTEMKMYRPDGTLDEKGASQQSDHELVYATVGEVGSAGGKRRTHKRHTHKRHTKKRSHNKKRKTHRR